MNAADDEFPGASRGAGPRPAAQEPAAQPDTAALPPAAPRPVPPRPAAPRFGHEPATASKMGRTETKETEVAAAAEAGQGGEPEKVPVPVAEAYMKVRNGLWPRVCAQCKVGSRPLFGDGLLRGCCSRSRVRRTLNQYSLPLLLYGSPDVDMGPHPSMSACSFA